MQRAPWLSLLLASASALTSACGSASVRGTAPARDAQRPRVEPLLHGTYAVTSISHGTGALADTFDIARSHSAAGSRLTLHFDGDAVEVELSLVEVVPLVSSRPTADTFVVVSKCAASASAVWNDQGFALTGDRQTLGGASATVMRSAPGAVTDVQVDSLLGQSCAVSLEPDEFVIAERGPVGADGRPSSVVLRYGAEGESVVHLTAAVPSTSPDPVELAVHQLAPRELARDGAIREATVLRIGIEADGTVLLEVARNGAQRLASTPVTADALREHARAAHLQDPSAFAMLSVDSAVPFGDVIAVIDLLRQSDLQRFSFSTRQPAPRDE